MQEIILTDIGIFLKLLCVLFLAFGSNAVFSIYHNTANLKEQFDKDKFFRGVLKCLVFVIGSTMLILAINFTTYIFNKFGIVSEQVGDIVTVASMFLSLGAAIVKYLKEAYEKFVTILAIEK